VKIEETFEIAVPIERMYREINDIGEIGYCIAGVQDVRVISDTESAWKVEARAGFMARTFNLAGRITERRPPEYLAFAGSGQDVEITGHVLLEPVEAGGTRCETVVEATVTGAFAPIVDLMARGPQQQLIQQTIDNLRKRLENLATEEVGAPVAVATKAEPARVGLFARIGRWFRGLFRAR
jgi:carbon monoxide dehydrogenase subunit G